MIWVFSSILLSVELILTQEARFLKSCSHWKFFKPQLPLRFPVKTDNHWLYDEEQWYNKDGGQTLRPLKHRLMVEALVDYS